jgi:hypothetical protein
MSREPAAAPRPDLRGLSLLDFIPKISPELTRPDHWKVIADALSRAIRGNLRIVFSAPVQHGKSVLASHAIPWWHAQDESLSIFYATYAQQYTEIRSREIRRLTETVGCRFREDHKRLDGWSFERGGRAVMTSIDGPGTGLPGNIFVVDDPFKNETDAWSKERRDQVHGWYKSVLTTRRAPKASYFVIASRWDDDDLSGRLIRDDGYDEVRLPAICDDPATDPNGRSLGDPLCPWGPKPDEPRDLEFLNELRRDLGEYRWSALCQGKPTPRDSALFQRAPVARMLPLDYRAAIGIDLGFTTKGDYTAIVVLVEDSITGDVTVAHVQRVKKRIPQVAEALGGLSLAWPGVDLFAYYSGPELGTIQLLQDAGFQLAPMPARYSKFVRAQNTAAAWGSGRLGVPKVAAWDLPGFISRLRAFTGEEGGEDDETDALVAAFDGLAAGVSDMPAFFGRRIM